MSGGERMGLASATVLSTAQHSSRQYITAQQSTAADSTTQNDTEVRKTDSVTNSFSARLQ